MREEANLVCDACGRFGAMPRFVPLDKSKRLVNALKRDGVKEVKLTVYPEANHYSWAGTYSSPAIRDVPSNGQADRTPRTHALSCP